MIYEFDFPNIRKKATKEYNDMLCVDYRTVESSTEISLRFGCKDMDVSRLSSRHLGECSYALDEEDVSNCCRICSGTCFLCSCRCI